MGEIVSLMRAENIGSVIIVWSDGSIAGLISEREIVAGLEQYGAKVMQLTTRDLMVTGFSQVEPHETV
ncbi:hypothetical protein [Brucella cytisi]|uniref:hypothetical protein n=1 Tax=Brucella cytisi TaxID=407152 RepID=UPI0035DE8CBC